MRALTAALLALGASAVSARASAAAVRYESAFTTLAPAACRAAADGPAGSVRECPGRDGIRVLLATDDVRHWLRLRVARDETDLMLAITGSVTPVASPPVQTWGVARTQLEWRYRVDGARHELIALIVRVVDPARAAGRPQAQLLVLRVTPDATFCVVSSATTAAAAHRLADGPTICHWIIPPRETS